MVQGKINTEALYTNHPAERHSIWTTQRPISITHPPFFVQDALPVATLPLYPGLGQTPNAGLHTQWHG